MEFEAGFLENPEMFMMMAYSGQDDYFSLSREEQKNHDGIENVLVEKFTDCGTTSTDSDTDVDVFEGTDSWFDTEWMTAKIDVASCLTEQLDSNFNVLAAEPENSIVADLLVNKPVGKIDVLNSTSGSTDESVFDKYVPISPEQHVPDVDAGIGQFEALLNSYLAATQNMAEDVSILGDEDVTIGNTTNADLKRKMSDSTTIVPKKVKMTEQKQRKRLQNRNAATKYRCKKRSEQETLNAQCSELEDDNDKLCKRIEGKQQEIQYLKNLIIDVFNKKPAKK